MGHFHGLLRERRRVLPLLVLSSPWLRSYRTRRHLRAGMPAHGRGASLRLNAVAEEDQAAEHAVRMVQGVDRARSNTATLSLRHSAAPCRCRKSALSKSFSEISSCTRCWVAPPSFSQRSARDACLMDEACHAAVSGGPSSKATQP